MDVPLLQEEVADALQKLELSRIPLKRALGQLVLVFRRRVIHNIDLFNAALALFIAKNGIAHGKIVRHIVEESKSVSAVLH